jgi:hypothetical protein
MEKLCPTMMKRKPPSEHLKNLWNEKRTSLKIEWMQWDKKCAKLEVWFFEMKVAIVMMQGRIARRKSWKWKKKHIDEDLTKLEDMNQHKPSISYGINYFMILFNHVVSLVSSFSSELLNISKIEYKIKKIVIHIF